MPTLRHSSEGAKSALAWNSLENLLRSMLTMILFFPIYSPALTTSESLVLFPTVLRQLALSQARLLSSRIMEKLSRAAL
jgi:hypothetical protein